MYFGKHFGDARLYLSSVPWLFRWCTLHLTDFDRLENRLYKWDGVKLEKHSYRLNASILMITMKAQVSLAISKCYSPDKSPTANIKHLVVVVKPENSQNRKYRE